MEDIRSLLSELIDEVEVASDVDACIDKYAKKIELAWRYQDTPSYALLACRDSGRHMCDVDERGNCAFCHEQ